MIRFIRALFAWQQVSARGAWLYFENAITGQRAAEIVSGNIYGPVDLDWLDAGCGCPLVNGRPAWRSAEGQISGRYC